MRCHYCDSEVECINTTYPRSYECKKCKLIFLNLPSTFADETL